MGLLAMLLVVQKRHHLLCMADQLTLDMAQVVKRHRRILGKLVPLGPFPGMMNPIDGMIATLPSSDASLDAGLLSQDPTADQTPITHAAPFPSEGPVDKNAEQLDVEGRRIGSTRQLLDSLRVHASNTGASLKRLLMPQMLAKQDQWTGFFNPESGNDIVPPIPGSVSYNAGGFGANDHISNAYHKSNEYGFNTAHRHRRFATGPIPGNFMWMKPGGRPMVRSFTGQHNFPTSGYFAGDDPGSSYSYQGAVLVNTPPEYVAPPQVNLGAAAIDINSAPQTIPEIPLY